MPASPLAAVLGLTMAFSPWSTGSVPLRSTSPLAPSVAGMAMGPEEADAPADSDAEGGDAEPEGDDNGWGDEDTVDSGVTSDPAAPADGTATPPTPAEAAAVGASTPPTPVADGIVKKPAPLPDQSKKGYGLLISAGVVGAIAWGAAGARIGLIRRCVDTDQTVNNLFDCVRQVSSYLGLTAMVWIANDVTYGLGPGAGMVRGRYEAAEYVYSGKYDRKGKLWTGIGGGVFGVGLLSKITLWALTFNVFKCPTETIEDIENVDDCLRRRMTGQLLAHQFASGMIAGGAGAMTYGIYYSKERASREKLFFRPETVRLTPWGSLDTMGLSLSAKF